MISSMVTDPVIKISMRAVTEIFDFKTVICRRYYNDFTMEAQLY